MLSSLKIFRSCYTKVSSSCRTYANRSDLTSIKYWLSEFPGGNVTLSHSTRSDMDLAIITISNPASRNAITGQMICQLDDAISELETNTPKGVIIRGEGGHFCSGAELNFVRDIANPREGNHMSKFVQWLTKRITCLRAISVALVEGSAMGGGAEISLSCDYRLASPTFNMAFKNAIMGVTTGMGGGTRLVRLVERERALKLLISGKNVNADEALAYGLVDRIIATDNPDDPDKALAEAEDFLWEIVGKTPHEIIHTIKRLVNYIDFRDTQDALDEELKIFSTLWGGPLHKEALESVKGRFIK